STWRDQIRELTKDLPIDFVSPMENHDRSDNIGEEILGTQANALLKDETASQFNNLRTRVWMNRADVVIAYFGEKYKQWNTAMDVGIALANDTPLIVIREEGASAHALKEVMQRAQAVVGDFEQAAAALRYIFEAE
ncbi:MAG: YtoQ family protein, partial [Bacteroidota bacterium]